MSNLDQALSQLAKRVELHAATIGTEEAAKTSVVLPFLQALGYDVFNPAEVVPEYTADAVGKKGEKVDYAVMRDGEVSILIECKGMSTTLSEKHLAQLYRYFSVTKARFAVLTNGREFRFHSDLEEANKLDRRPFFTFDLLDYSAQAVAELEKFARDGFDLDNILAQAERLKYVSAIKKTLTTWMAEPSDGLVKLVASDVYDGRLNSEIRAMIASGIGMALTDIVRDRVRSRLNTALDDTPSEQAAAQPLAKAETVTTEAEIEGWLTVKTLLRGTVAGDRIVLRDAKSYCAILLDDNNRKPLLRLHFNRSQKFVGLFDGEAEDRQPINSLDDMLGFAERLRATALKYAA
ncbi:type I restriction endonuclease [Jannaschia donghaensis]|uniref:Type I restriction enzyme R protein N-terminal domain-containing protein n=1 Tax=Jannaschia donghaensis TaxID=420998 RepID=A0A0M6YIH4_9RHOB|nr:type I restriction endonuclease [Jannaschia donghaensis]CTQ49724.1 hypothetical protein JDO7802_01740 [Jannaschia donghaensis]